MTALGSGFIVDPSGDIVTNNHVIDAATDIGVTLTDGSRYSAKVVGSDPQTDLALLKVDAERPLPYVGSPRRRTLHPKPCRESGTANRPRGGPKVGKGHRPWRR